MPYTKEEHQEVASKMQRDEHGHFNKKAEQASSPSEASREGGSGSSSSSFTSALKRLITPNVSKIEDEDTLIDVHVSNPLKRIVDLLQDIKKQKVFSFSLKGSLGLAGVALVLTGIGLFGGTQAFCTKGVQSHIGTIKILQTQEEVTESTIPILSPARNALSKAMAGGQIPLISSLTSLITPTSQITRNRIILVKSDNSTIHLIPSRNFSLAELTNLPMIVTGDYNSCSQTLTLKNTSSIELFK